MKLKDIRMGWRQDVWGTVLTVFDDSKSNCPRLLQRDLARLVWGRKRVLRDEQQTTVFVTRLCKAFNDSQKGK